MVLLYVLIICSEAGNPGNADNRITNASMNTITVNEIKSWLNFQFLTVCSEFGNLGNLDGKIRKSSVHINRVNRGQHS